MRANFKSISHRCHLFEVAFVKDLTKEAINLPWVASRADYLRFGVCGLGIGCSPSTAHPTPGLRDDVPLRLSFWGLVFRVVLYSGGLVFRVGLVFGV